MLSYLIRISIFDTGMKVYQVIENIRIALASIRSHMLRTVLTILIIGFGIMALVGILTAIESIKSSITDNFSRMGANTFSLRNRGARMQVGRAGKPKVYPQITFHQALRFKQKYRFDALTSISTYATWGATVKFGDEKTNPNISVMGVDENYLKTNGYELQEGRNFTATEAMSGNHYAIIGNEIKKKLFPSESPVDKLISIGPGKYIVIGLLKEKGSSMGFSGDRSCILPINNTRQYFSQPDASFNISVMANNPDHLEMAIGEATSTFRNVRKLQVGEENNFEVAKSDNMAQMLLENIQYVTMAATIIGLITLLGAAIGLMNIMLVSVTERTREIGIRKAIGATKSTIKSQFLTEAIVICQLGGLVGVALGIPIGNIVSFFLDGQFIVPWVWIITSILLCFLVGMISGIYPAIKAANLDPIDALRYE
jgi:putative ABC transport system permease protein